MSELRHTRQRAKSETHAHYFKTAPVASEKATSLTRPAKGIEITENWQIQEYHALSDSPTAVIYEVT